MGNEISDFDVDVAVACGFFTPDGADVLVRVFAPLHTPRFANLPTISTVADGKGRIYRFRLKWLTAALPFV
ncbi:hypothetical protein SDC9_15464 [bioreactor metagenome]|jgi:hypothetical protein|uniref:Uncharacterized protein n=1 Tax=bioreactor metagenome TaxID=1076179 RepID=A0A644TRV2_9ZZZZ